MSHNTTRNTLYVHYNSLKKTLSNKFSTLQKYLDLQK